MDKLSSMTLLLEAFGNSRTILNTSASRFSQITTLDFDHNGQVVSASIQVGINSCYLELDKSGFSPSNSGGANKLNDYSFTMHYHSQ